MGELQKIQIQKLVNDSNKITTSKANDLFSEPEMGAESDSDAGLPPPLPQKSMGFKLQIGGLGLSTVAGENGLTAE